MDFSDGHFSRAAFTCRVRIYWTPSRLSGWLRALGKTASVGWPLRSRNQWRKASCVTGRSESCGLCPCNGHERRFLKPHPDTGAQSTLKRASRFAERLTPVLFAKFVQDKFLSLLLLNVRHFHDRKNRTAFAIRQEGLHQIPLSFTRNSISWRNQTSRCAGSVRRNHRTAMPSGFHSCKGGALI